MYNSNEALIEDNQGYGGYEIPNTTAWQQGLIVGNYFFDYQSYQRLQQLVATKDSNSYKLFYEAPVNPDTFLIFQGDPVIRLKDELASTDESHNILEGSIADNGAKRIVGCLNGLGYFDPTGEKEAKMLNPNIPMDVKKRMLYSKTEFVGFAQTHFNFTKEGMRNFTKNLAMPVQMGGVETVFNTGKNSIRPFKKIVYSFPDFKNLDLYPPRLNNFMKGRSRDTVLIELKEYDPNDEVNLSNLFNLHKTVFDRVAGYRFGNPKNYVKDNYDSIDLNFSLIGIHQGLFNMLFATSIMSEIARSQVYTEANYDEWKDEIKLEHIGEIIRESQKWILKSKSGNIITVMDEVVIQRALRVTLLAMETCLFSEFTDVYRSGKNQAVHSFDFKRFAGGSGPTVFKNINNLTKWLNDRIIGTSLSAAAPGYTFDILGGQARTCA